MHIPLRHSIRVRILPAMVSIALGSSCLAQDNVARMDQVVQS